MGFKLRTISHGLNRAVSTVMREIGPAVRSDPHAAMMTADLELPVIRTETGGNAGSHIRPPDRNRARNYLRHAEEIFEPFQVNGSRLVIQRNPQHSSQEDDRHFTEVRISSSTNEVTHLRITVTQIEIVQVVVANYSVVGTDA